MKERTISFEGEVLINVTLSLFYFSGFLWLAVFSHHVSNLQPAAVLVFQPVKEALLQQQLAALVLHVGLQGRTSHDPLAVKVK